MPPKCFSTYFNWNMCIYKDKQGSWYLKVSNFLSEIFLTCHLTWKSSVLRIWGARELPIAWLWTLLNKRESLCHDWVGNSRVSKHTRYLQTAPVLSYRESEASQSTWSPELWCLGTKQSTVRHGKHPDASCVFGKLELKERGFKMFMYSFPSEIIPINIKT